MEARCPHCAGVASILENVFGNRDKADVTCPSCGKVFSVLNPTVSTLRLKTVRKSAPGTIPEITEDGRRLELPRDKNISLKVLEGFDVGTVSAVAKPRITIGRSNADITLADRMGSRAHCALEISGDSVLLRDLGSTNGRIVGRESIATASLTDGATFRVGMHKFQLSIRPKGA